MPRWPAWQPQHIRKTLKSEWLRSQPVRLRGKLYVLYAEQRIWPLSFLGILSTALLLSAQVTCLDKKESEPPSGFLLGRAGQWMRILLFSLEHKSQVSNILKNKLTKCLQAQKHEVFNISVTRSDHKVLFIKVFVLKRKGNIIMKRHLVNSVLTALKLIQEHHDAIFN